MEDFVQENSRRKFLKTGLASVGGLVIAFQMPEGFAKLMAAGVEPNVNFSSGALPNAFIKIASDNSITIIINKLEMGQGVFTSLAQLIAEELECDWTQIHCEAATVNPVYNHTYFPVQMAGGSTSLASSWHQHRMLGAMAREMLKQAAAKKWGVPSSELRVEQGKVLHPLKGSLSFGQLADAAALETPPKTIVLKESKDFKIIGKSIKRLDAAAKVNGQALFGLDIKIPGMLYAVVARPPFGAKLQSADEVAAKKIPGVVDLVHFADKIAILASNSWAAMKGRDALKAQWSLSDAPNLSQKTLLASYRVQLDKPGTLVKEIGKPSAALKKATKIEEASYEFPYLAHACMEPLNCTIHFDGKTAQIWSGHQIPGADRGQAAAVLGIPPESIHVTTTFAGGSFGRRASKTSDFVVEAAQLAKLVKKPLKLVWSREDDMRAGYYRPLTMHKIKAGLSKDGAISGWQHSIVGQSVMAASIFGAAIEKTGIDSTSIEGVDGSPYDLKDFHLQLQLPKSEVTTLWWRSVGHTHTAYVMETFIDQLAEAAKVDALSFRQKLLKKSPRHLAVLDLLAKKSPWGKTPEKAHAYGLAIHESFKTVVAHLVDVSLLDNKVQIHKVYSAVHCGMVVNPAGARSQIEGAIVYGLSAALYGQITLDRGQVEQSNFHDYPVLRFNQMPATEVYFVESQDAPTGLGEPGLPPIAPAIANAIYKLSAKRIRTLPISQSLEIKA